MNRLITSALGKLNSNDFIKSAITSVFVAVMVAIGGVIAQPNFDLFTADWSGILHLALNVAAVTFWADILRRLGTDSSGKLFGKIG